MTFPLSGHLDALQVSREEVKLYCGKVAEEMCAVACVERCMHTPLHSLANNDGGGHGKVSNPKDVIADARVPLWLLSTVAKVHWAVAHFAGLLKYGSWNWRVAGVRCSVYLSAMERHMEAYKSGERLDPTDGTHHLGNVMACCALILEGEAAGKLIDDRPPSLDHRPTLAEAEATIAALKVKYADRKPRHWTIADTEGK